MTNLLDYLLGLLINARGVYCTREFFSSPVCSSDLIIAEGKAIMDDLVHTSDKLAIIPNDD